MKLDPPALWLLSDGGSADGNPNAPDRLVGWLNLPNRLWLALGRESIDKPWPRRVTLSLEHLRSRDDMIWCMDGGPLHVVTDRFRRVMEELAPDHAEYLPIHRVLVKRTGRPLPDQRFWAVRWTRSVVAVDRERSKWQVDSSLPRGGYWSTVATMPSLRLTPASILVFRDREQPSLLWIRDSLRRKLTERGLRGPQFYRCSYVEADGSVRLHYKPNRASLALESLPRPAVVIPPPLPRLPDDRLPRYSAASVILTAR